MGLLFPLQGSLPLAVDPGTPKEKKMFVEGFQLRVGVDHIEARLRRCPWVTSHRSISAWAGPKAKLKSAEA
jgi:hypothetical protein